VSERSTDGLEHWKHLLMHITHGPEPAEQIASRVRALIGEFREQANAADQIALKKWLHDRIGSISYQVVPASGLEKLNLRVHALRAALDALEQ
jgi:hypothetical protein